MGRNRKSTRGAAPAEAVTKSIDTSIEDASWSMALQGLIYDGEYLVRDAIEADEDFVGAMEYLGLNPKKSRDIEVMAAVIGAFGDMEGDIFVRPPSGGYDLGIISVSTAVDSQRGFKVLPDRIEVSNVAFAKGIDGADNMGLAMLARQAWALRQLGKRLGKPVVVTTSALSDADSWVGVQVWPRMGYTFQLTGILRERAMANGFQSRNTADLMAETNAAGQSGFDVWGKIVGEALRYMPDNELRATGRMVVTDDNDPGMRLLMQYGQRKGVWE